MWEEWNANFICRKSARILDRSFHIIWIAFILKNSEIKTRFSIWDSKKKKKRNQCSIERRVHVETFFSKITEERFIKTILKFRLMLQFLLLMLWPSPKPLSFKREIFTWNLFTFNRHPTPSNSGTNCRELAPDPTCKSSVPQGYTTPL